MGIKLCHSYMNLMARYIARSFKTKTKQHKIDNSLKPDFNCSTVHI